MNEFIALLFTLITGFFFVMGMLITYFTKNNDRFIQFSISTAFGVIITLIIFELLPESIEYIGENYSNVTTYLLVFLLAFLGIVILKVLDHFIPDHELEHKHKKDIDNNLFHIGFVASIALILHNVIEGMAIYSSISTGFDLGILVMLGVGLHNIPMGMVLASTLSKSNSSKKKKIFFLTFVTLSTFIGGIIMASLHFLISNLFLGILLSITLGMLIYIAVFELLGEILEAHDNKISTIGILVGVLIFIISIFFE